MDLFPHLSNLSRSIGFTHDPTQVYEVSWETYKKFVCKKNDRGLFIYDVPENKREEAEYRYEIIILFENDDQDKESKAYSLLRADNLNSALEYFDVVSKIILPLKGVCPQELNDVDVLSKIAIHIKLHPTWTLAHYAVACNLPDAFESEEFRSLINTPDEENKVTPLLLAVKESNLEIIKILIKLGADPKTVDSKGNTVAHLAAGQSSEILSTLSSYIPKDVVNQKNDDGKSPLMLATLGRHIQNVNMFIALGLKESDKIICKTIDFVTEMDCGNYDYRCVANGGNVLHWLKNSTIMLKLIGLGFDINGLNTLGQTPLHVKVIEKRLNCVMALLGKNCDPDIQDNLGNTPLHYAVESLNVHTTIALYVFGADGNIKNKDNKTPRHIASTIHISSSKEEKICNQILNILHLLGANRCRDELSTCQTGCAPKGYYNGNPISIPRLNKRTRWMLDHELEKYHIKRSTQFLMEKCSNKIGKGRILCLDGGGMKGLASTQILSVIERTLGKPVHECFDLIAGTSIGGFLTIMLASGFSWKKAQHMLCSLKNEVFVGSKPYNSERLKEILQKEFGENKRMCDIKDKKVILHAVAADRMPVELHRFRNYESPDMILGLDEGGEFKRPPLTDCMIWHAALASGSAPIYFRPHEEYLDGAFYSNNPVVDVLTEIEELNTALKIKGRDHEIFEPSVVVSVGCSQGQIEKINDLDINSWKFLEATKNILSITANNCSATDGPVVDRARAWCSSINLPYFRFNPLVANLPELDETDPTKLLNLMLETRSYMETRIDDVKRLKTVLLPDEDICDLSEQK